MRLLILPLAGALCLTSCAQLSESDPPPNEQTLVFQSADGETVTAMQGSITVPEHRGQAGSRNIVLDYVRFPAANAVKGPPIIYLAGGPGGSGIETARGPRFPLFMALRQFGDVVALDQRGTGKSSPLPRCDASQRIIDDREYTDEAFAELHRQAAIECFEFWKRQGIDPAGYTTLQSALDLDDLRKHLGAKQLRLWGISYGTHLGLAALKYLPGSIDRAVFASVEGLDQTVKRPAETEAYFARLQEYVNARPDLKAKHPDLLARMRRVHESLDASPKRLSVQPVQGEVYDFLLERRDVQMMATQMIADPEMALQLADLYAALDAGFYEPVAALIAQWHRPGAPISFRLMPLVMDLASGISPAELNEVQRQAREAVLGDYLNFPMPQINRVWPELDLGNDFRTGPNSDVPVLVLSGTLDGRIDVQSQRRAISGLANATQVLVRNAGHNLFMRSPLVQQRIEDFLRGEAVSEDAIVVEVPLAGD